MATDLERLVVQLSADIKRYENALNRAMGQTNRQARNIERRFQTMNRNLTSGFAGLGSSLAKAFAVAGGVRGLQSLLDSATRVDNALKVVGLSGGELERVYGRLRKAASDNGAPLETLVSLYSRMMQSQKGLKASSEEIENLTTRIAEGLRVQGVSAEQARGPLIQLAQSFSSVIVRAEEFNSLSEGMPIILHAIAAGLKEANGDIGQLRKLVIDGKVSSEAWFRALEAGSVIIQQKVGGATLTVGQGLENMRTAMIDAMREFARGSMAADSLGEAFDMMAQKINSLNFEEFGKEVRSLIDLLGQLQTAIGWVRNLGANFGSATGLDRIGEVITGGNVHRELGPVTITSTRALQRRIDEAFGQTVESAGNLTVDALKNWADRNGLSSPASGGKTGRLPASGAISPVSLDDFGDPAKNVNGSGGRGGRSKQDAFAREIEQIKERTAAIHAETAAMMGLNPLIEDYGYTLEKARAKQDLLTAAKRAGVAITPELEANIEKLAESYAQASVEAEKLAESQGRARQAAEDLRDLGKDVLGGFIQDLRAGKSASEALANALQKVADKLLNIALDNLFSGGFGGKGGLLGGFLIPGILHKGGVAGRDGYGHGRAVSPAVFAGAKRYHRGGVAGLQPGEVPAILQRGEVVLPRGAAVGQSGQVVVNFSPQIDASGADPAAIQRLEGSLNKLKAEIPATVVETVRKAQKSNVKLG